ncbi:pantoate--beta-alanine ligase [Flavobacteriaceae bacterium S356]|uniref:Pantothenate synthetase n=1 Tax=Asprobacillus argus TaxID=3076534 RepID=A0ABU3LC50_9FLAO|nr:pantoate--beta-alanine ligase [Flavobacteriaceae bacterium S356]
MLIFKTKEKLINHLTLLKAKNLSVGFVPTMGALHLGHLSLIKTSKENNDVTVASIFVNPTQFDNKKDLINYPLTIDKDIKLLQNEHCDILFLPPVSEMYDQSVSAQKFDFDGLEFEMEGKHRAGHFDGVGTIVKSFFDIIKPHNAYFGEKDFQQLQIVKKMVEKHNISVQVHGCPIYREQDGLAMSSRNTRLTFDQRQCAPFIHATLQKAAKLFEKSTIDDVVKWVENEFEQNAILALEYFTVADVVTLRTASKKETGKTYRGFIAAFAGEIRLIDNIELNT